MGISDSQLRYNMLLIFVRKAVHTSKAAHTQTNTRIFIVIITT